jgi:uncharacterized protein (DUF58 family)
MTSSPQAMTQSSGLTPAPARNLRPRWSLSGHAHRLITLALTGLAIAVITRRAEFAGVAAPAVLLLAAWQPSRPERIGVSARVNATRVVEGETAAIQVTVSGYGQHAVEVRLHPADSVVQPAAEDRRPDRSPAGVAAGPPGTAPEEGVPFQVTRSGSRSIGTLEVVLRDRWRLTEGRVSVVLPKIDCYPRPTIQETRVVLSRLPNRLGEHPSRASGEGIEFTGVRDFVPGDRQRRINWPATTRRGRLQLNTFAAERTQTVVVIADATSDVGEPGRTALDLALRGSATTVRSYLTARDRVGCIIYRQGVRWVAPALGMRHFYRIMDLMLADAAFFTVGTGISRLPRAALPPGSLIILFSPLLDRRLVEAVRDLRERGFSILIVDVLNAEPSAGSDSIAAMARKIWRMEQHAIRFSLRELGIPLVHWDGMQSLDEPLAPYTRRVMVGQR